MMTPWKVKPKGYVQVQILRRLVLQMTNPNSIFQIQLWREIETKNCHVRAVVKLTSVDIIECQISERKLLVSDLHAIFA